MSVRFLFDTCFLIDLEREKKRGAASAHDFLRVHPHAVPCVSWIVAGEFAEGFGDIDHPSCAAMLAHLEIVAFDRETAGHYARAAKYLRSRNQLIGANDLWIAASALAHGLPLVTRNTAHFSRVPALTLLSY